MRAAIVASAIALTLILAWASAQNNPIFRGTKQVLPSKNRVLVVDDSIFQRNIARDALNAHGFSVVGEALNGIEAEEMYAELKPDLVLMDLVMPFRSGVDATRGIVGNSPKATILIVGSPGQEALVMEAVEIGAADFIVKPYQNDELIYLARKVLGDEDASLGARVAQRKQLMESEAGKPRKFAIEFSAPATVAYSERSETVSADLLRKLEVTTKEQLVEYIWPDEPLWTIGLSRGTFELRFDNKNGTLMVQTIFEAPRRLDPKELELLREFTTGQWSDGAGENWDHETAIRLGVVVSLPVIGPSSPVQTRVSEIDTR